MKLVTEFDLKKGFENLFEKTGMNANQIEKEAGLGRSSISKMMDSNNASMVSLWRIAKATNQKTKGKTSLCKLYKTMEIN